MHAQDALDLHILCMFEDAFSLDVAHMIFCKENLPLKMNETSKYTKYPKYI